MTYLTRALLLPCSFGIKGNPAFLLLAVDMNDLKGKVALVTGATSGIGLETAAALAGGGHSLRSCPFSMLLLHTTTVSSPCGDHLAIVTSANLYLLFENVPMDMRMHDYGARGGRATYSQLMAHLPPSISAWEITGQSRMRLP